MSLYNILFGQNAHADLLLAVIGLREVDVERFRDVHAEDQGKTIAVYTRTGGGNRSDYPQRALYANPLFDRTEDDDFDSTYATFYFRTPEQFVRDVCALADPLKHGLRKGFAQHLAKTLAREPTDADKDRAACDREAAELRRTRHFMANGHTFVPQDDDAMEAALRLAEANGGELRSAWGIMPLALTIKTNFKPYPNARSEEDRARLKRVEVDYDYSWKIDTEYWAHCEERFAAKYPLSMSKISDQVRQRLERAA